MKNVVLGVTGSIAAYKAADITNALTKSGYNVDVILTKGGAEFITPLTLQTLSKNRVYTDMFELDYPREVTHISLCKKADLFVIAPASADIIGKIANGIADDMLSTVALAMQGIPLLIAPAMNTRMYENPIVKDNLEKLKKHGYEIIEPKESLLACGDLGKGALADVGDILRAITDHLQEKTL
ncbi:phosphopantothenoylcysteine decarboxylase [Caproiciproducens galactitolivorans]|uniref:Coenzyme A biosynthesis bifunctional protein CoaBC n=1 Tax=Caproiciproducens galactitolivorans TaxID=642589 RepID=A0A4Z0YJ02_9FIRM|nr:phosphopantothenoylcysteine decarboxylase [Caproiciproducens galactitolivorans]QEY35161.1 phosphopantothenoylcysteine decarboxylase [Caproiciproducens galactitolivorans]TGJ76852.1 coenzyme A biosynthesis bifunctional protein CoaBC [Caproiciproducens galactitolivorans]